MLAEILSKMETLSLKEASQGDTLAGPGVRDTDVGPVLPVPTSACSSGSPWPPPRMLFCPTSREAGLGHRGALAGPCAQCPSVADRPAAGTMQGLPHRLLFLCLCPPEPSRNAPDRRHNPPAVGRAGQARPAPSHLHARDPERGRAGSEDEGGRAAQVQPGPSSCHHTEGNAPAPRRKGRAATSSRKPAWSSN